MLNLTDKGIDSLATKEGRQRLTKTGFMGFCMAYLRHKFVLEPAPFHVNIMDSLDTDKDFIAILGHRGCAKSTIVELYALYVLVEQLSPYTIYIGSTDSKSRKALANIKSELESNMRLQKDYKLSLGDKKKGITEKWSEGQITIGNCTIEAKSKGATDIRGSKFNDARLTLIICDDIEDTDNTRTLEARTKTRNWFFSEVVPATAQGSLADDVKIVMIGNLVHRDCLLAHLDNKKLENNNIVTVHKYFLYDENNEIRWKALYPTQEAVDKQKQLVMLSGDGMGQIIWAREYLGKMIDESEQVIQESDIQYYPPEWLQRKVLSSGVGVDLAISLKSTADYTAMVKGYIVTNDYGERRLLILPKPIKARLDFTQTLQTAKNLKAELQGNPIFYVEDVAYQRAAIEMMQKNGLQVEGKRPTTDKRARLTAVSPYIKSGMVLFPKEGASAILEEILGFGIEAHDDCMDALVHLISGMLDKPTVIIA